ncbi:Integrase catalytic domain-containing protein [Abeliophyllum distichum]|uniref:Integrase catalytic domain-containing protein n=1 Tax=Abeliophyllum distichum TaxID=126358 RepID=A0ABD1QU23_9LAMI
MEKYDGSSDPVDHVRAFVDLMRLRATPDAIMCRTFPLTLKREARDWVATLPFKPIANCCKKFVAYTASSKCAKKNDIGLMQLTQDKDELLKDFIARFDVKRVLVDNGSAADVMSWKVFLVLKISPSKIKPVTTLLHGFGGATVIPEGKIELPVTLDTYPASVPNGQIEPLELTEDVIIAEGQVLKIGGGMDLEEKHKLVACLFENIDVFTWGLQDIEGINPMIASA